MYEAALNEDKKGPIEERKANVEAKSFKMDTHKEWNEVNARQNKVFNKVNNKAKEDICFNCNYKGHREADCKAPLTEKSKLRQAKRKQR